MLFKSKGIVIKTTRFSETSLISQIYTRHHGMLSFIIQGAYSKRSTIKPSMLQPLQTLHLNYYYKENNNLNKIKEVKIEPILSKLHFDIKKIAIVTVISELVNKSVKEEETNEDFFDFLFESIINLDRCENNIRSFVLVFMIQMSKFLGFFPTNNYSTSTPNFNLNEGIFTHNVADESITITLPESKTFGSIINVDTGEISQCVISNKVRLYLIRKMIRYYQIHVSNFSELNSYNILMQVFSS